MSAPADVVIGSVWVPKRNRQSLPTVTVRQIHRADRAVTLESPDGRFTRPWKELRAYWKPVTP